MPEPESQTEAPVNNESETSGVLRLNSSAGACHPDGRAATAGSADLDGRPAGSGRDPTMR